MDANFWNTIQAYAMNLVGTPYIYGGKNPMTGLDCSGLVCEILQAMGAVPFQFETNAQGLYNHFLPMSEKEVIAVGSLAFYGNGETGIDHVAFFLNPTLIIEAGHGTPETLTVQIATSRGARTRIRSYKYRKDLVTIIRPKYESMGL